MPPFGLPKIKQTLDNHNDLIGTWVNHDNTETLTLHADGKASGKGVTLFCGCIDLHFGPFVYNEAEGFWNVTSDEEGVCISIRWIDVKCEHYDFHNNDYVNHVVTQDCVYHIHDAVPIQIMRTIQHEPAQFLFLSKVEGENQE